MRLVLLISLLVLVLSMTSVAAAVTTAIRGKVPKLVAFDLDGTIWSPDMYELWGGGAPFEVVGDGTKSLRDRSGTKVNLLGISGSILHDLRYDEEWKDTKTAWVSKTDEPRWAMECLQKFRSTPGKEPIGSLIDSVQIYKGNKQDHFRQLKSEFPDIAFEEMIFFDNEYGNIQTVSKLGVCCIYCPDGVTQEIWDQGLNQFAIGCNPRDKGL